MRGRCGHAEVFLEEASTRHLPPRSTLDPGLPALFPRRCIDREIRG
jgi:hypothetical protein